VPAVPFGRNNSPANPALFSRHGVCEKFIQQTSGGVDAVEPTAYQSRGIPPMVNQQTLQGQWNQIKGKIREKWGQLTDDDLTTFSGNVEQLVGLLQQRTGEGREAIENFLDSATSGDLAGMAGRMGEKARDYAQQAATGAQHMGSQMADSMRRSYSQAGELVHENPGNSVLIALGAGLFTGLLLGMMFRTR
jgi:uncharacterized protein YjbJ (UPF0337 family)